MKTEPLPGPLAGLRVMELADEKGQFCGKLLGDLGADVVKIEPPGGERCRRVGPFLDDDPDPERSLSFWYYNTSKRGITLDLASADGRALFARMAVTADVILETFAPGFLAGLGLGYETLARNNPGRHVMFFAIGFETTAPSTGLTLMRAKAEGLKNFSVFCNHVTIIPAIRAIAARSPARPAPSPRCCARTVIATTCWASGT